MIFEYIKKNVWVFKYPENYYSGYRVLEIGDWGLGIGDWGLGIYKKKTENY